MNHGDQMYAYITIKYVYDEKYKYPVYYKLGFFFRASPVPGLRNWRSLGCYYRHPRTTQEARMYYAQDPIYTRGKRKPINLPCVYDDYVRSIERSWKQKKKKRQWG